LNSKTLSLSLTLLQSNKHIYKYDEFYAVI
jgi:hypothetical protein